MQLQAMQAIIEPGNISGSVTPPASKSMTQRVFAAALLHHGKTIVRNSGTSADETAMLRIAKELGAQVTCIDADTIEINSSGITPVQHNINCHESGLAARLMTFIAATSDMPFTINGSGSLLKRPIGISLHIMQQLGVTLSNHDGYLPLTIQGVMKPVNIIIDGAKSSQLLSGLLMAYCYCATEKVTIEVTDLKSKPYIDLTLQTLALFGKPISHAHYKQFYIDPLLFTTPNEVDVTIERDWSSAAFLLVAGAIAGIVTLHGLDLNSKQADRVIVDVLQQVGAMITETTDTVTIEARALNSFQFDATDCPDLIPILCILAGCCSGQSKICGVHRLIHKESDRKMSISEMLTSFGIAFHIEDNAFCITGAGTFKGGVIDPVSDHRIAMAATVGALRANDKVTINGAEYVRKSYPGFFRDMDMLGVKCGYS